MPLMMFLIWYVHYYAQLSDIFYCCISTWFTWRQGRS